MNPDVKWYAELIPKLARSVAGMLTPVASGIIVGAFVLCIVLLLIFRHKLAEFIRYLVKYNEYAKQEERYREAIERAKHYEATACCGSFLYLIHDPTPRKPICQVCWNKGDIVRMELVPSPYRGMMKSYQCPGCTATFVLPREDEERLFGELARDFDLDKGKA